GASRGTSGDWTAAATVGRMKDDNNPGDEGDEGSHTLLNGNLKDTLVVNARITDLGGNISEDGVSWLVKSDTLRLLRVGSTDTDGTYTHTSDGDIAKEDVDIDIFLEFNKPVLLRPFMKLSDAYNGMEGPPVYPRDYVVDPDRINTRRAPVLNLNVAGPTVSNIAVYTDHEDHHENHNLNDPIAPSARQHFKYSVKKGQSVEALNLSASEFMTELLSKNHDYPYTWAAATAKSAPQPGEHPWEYGEEVRMLALTTPNTGDIGDKGGYYTANLPTTTDTTASDYFLTLAAGKHIAIDTTPPERDKTGGDGIAISGRGGWYGINHIIYITMKFTEAVKFNTAPILVLNIQNGVIEERKTTGVQVNNDTLIFSYKIAEGDITPNIGSTGTPNYDVQIKRLDGIITDLAGNRYVPDIPLNFVPKDTGGRGVSVRAIKPLAPTVQMLTRQGTPGSYTFPIVNNGTGTSGGAGLAEWDTSPYLDSKAFSDAFRGIWVSGVTYKKGDIVSVSSTEHYYCIVGNNDVSAPASNLTKWVLWAENTNTPRVSLRNLYVDTLYIEVFPSGTPGIEYSRIEYSVNYGKDWGTYFTVSSTLPAAPTVVQRKDQNVKGYYAVTARQVDMAGNVSDWSKPITLNWENSELLTRISSTKANGTYTNNPSNDLANPRGIVPITLYFRKPVRITGSPVFTVSATNQGGDKQVITLNGLSPTVAEETFTFNYQIGETDTTKGQPLDLVVNDQGKLMGGTYTIYDEDSVDVTSYVDMIFIDANNTSLGKQKNIVIQTGIPGKRTNDPYFYNATGAAQGVNILEDSYQTTLEIEFDRNIFKSGSTYNNVPTIMTIIQKADGYRLPAVLTAAQYNNYRTALNTEISKTEYGVTVAPNTFILDEFYKEGTNGYVDTIGPDTSTKYILGFDIDTHSAAYQPQPRDTSGNPAGTRNQKFAEAFRQVEGMRIEVVSSIVEVSNSAKGVSPEWGRLTVRLNGSNALKVPGADYEINYPRGYVQDLLGNGCSEFPGSESGVRTNIYQGRVPQWSPAPTPLAKSIARPAIRASKAQEVISVADGGGSPARPVAGTSHPRFYVAAADRAGNAFIRMDCRTPDSVVMFTENFRKNENNNDVTSQNFGKYTATGVTAGSTTGAIQFYNPSTHDVGQTSDKPDSTTGKEFNASLGANFNATDRNFKIG
ncbi:MAG: hypothetical protein FWF22_08465, partial [Treponema sp.]|nr:hypothetical protein [Treponema sp.]